MTQQTVSAATNINQRGIEGALNQQSITTNVPYIMEQPPNLSPAPSSVSSISSCFSGYSEQEMLTMVEFCVLTSVLDFYQAVTQQGEITSQQSIKGNVPYIMDQPPSLPRAPSGVSFSKSSTN